MNMKLCTWCVFSVQMRTAVSLNLNEHMDSGVGNLHPRNMSPVWKHLYFSHVEVFQSAWHHKCISLSKVSSVVFRPFTLRTQKAIEAKKWSKKAKWGQDTFCKDPWRNNAHALHHKKMFRWKRRATETLKCFFSVRLIFEVFLGQVISINYVQPRFECI